MSRVLSLSSVLAEHCYMQFYRLGNNNQTDQGNETEGLKMEVLEWEGLEREGAKELYFV
jgi:hypothetical protein